MAVVAIARPPAGVDGKLRQVSEPSSFQCRIDSRRGAAHPSTKRVEVCGSSSMKDQVCVEKVLMTDFVIGVVVDIYGHVLVKHLQGFSVGFIPGTAWDFAILHAGQFIVLDPKVG